MKAVEQMFSLWYNTDGVTTSGGRLALYGESGLSDQIETHPGIR